MPDFFICIERIFPQDISTSHQHARSAKTALERVMVTKSLLKRSELLRTAKAFHRLYVASIRLHREHEAGTHAVPVEQDCAGAADTVLTSNVGAR